MKYGLSPLIFGLGASAAVMRRADQCCFSLTASGAHSGTSGTVGQLGDGQNRVGGGLPAATYCISNSAITDSNNRGCIFTPPTTQFQCDTGATPTSGFSVGSSGQVEYNGSSNFWACATGENGEYNIYTQAVENQKECYQISLAASSCSSQGQSSSAASPAQSSPTQQSSAQAQTETAYSTTEVTVTSCGPEVTSCPAHSTQVQTSTFAVSSQAPSSPAPVQQSSQQQQSSAPAQSSPQASSAPAQSSPKASSAPAQSSPQQQTSPTAQSTPVQQSSAPASTGSSCPTNLSGDYQYPHLIVQISNSQQSKAGGTSYNGTVNSDTSSIFNFDIPQSYSGKTCSLVFLFPEQSQLETSSYSFSGSGGIDFALLSGTASQSTSASNAPSVKTDYGVKNVSPGNSYSIASFSCPAGQAVSYELKASGDVSLNYFQDYNPSPIGLYVTSC